MKCHELSDKMFLEKLARHDLKKQLRNEKTASQAEMWTEELHQKIQA